MLCQWTLRWCTFKNLGLHYRRFKKKLGVIIIIISPNKGTLHRYLLGVEHARADNELEDVLEGFEGSEDGLTLFPSAGHIQIPLQH